MTDAQAITRNRSDVQGAIAVWDALAPSLKTRDKWIDVFAGVFQQVMIREKDASPSGDPEDADVPDCPAA